MWVRIVNTETQKDPVIITWGVAKIYRQITWAARWGGG